MPVGTQATVKGLTPAQVADTGTAVVLANTYHLMLRPGEDIVARQGGLHRFMGWDRVILTDSGGFQVFSLSDLRQVTDDGVAFQSHIDGAAFTLTPERSIAVQNALGADIIMAFDECPPLPCDHTALQTAVRRTIHWAERSRAAHQNPRQALYGIVQGGLDLNERRVCLAALAQMDFAGYAIGGLSVGEPPAEMHSLLAAFADDLPATKPRYLMGVGRPVDLVAAVASGVDQFDCVLPTRNGRKGYAFTSHGVVRMRNAIHREDPAPLDAQCDCYTCRHFSRAYLRHLFLVGEQLGPALVALHNVAFYQGLMRSMRTAIAADDFDQWRRAFLASAACCTSGDAE
jgi:queuine tRNA-ribosyltransferase